MRRKCRNICKSQWMFWLIVTLVFLNTCVLATEHHHQPPWLDDFQVRRKQSSPTAGESSEWRPLIGQDPSIYCEMIGCFRSTQTSSSSASLPVKCYWRCTPWVCPGTWSLCSTGQAAFALMNHQNICGCFQIWFHSCDKFHPGVYSGEPGDHATSGHVGPQVHQTAEGI